MGPAHRRAYPHLRHVQLPDRIRLSGIHAAPLCRLLAETLRPCLQKTLNAEVRSSKRQQARCDYRYELPRELVEAQPEQQGLTHLRPQQATQMTRNGSPRSNLLSDGTASRVASLPGLVWYGGAGHRVAFSGAEKDEVSPGM